MPSIMTHFLHAERVYKILDTSLSVTKVQREFFYWGIHGPKIFSASRRLDKPPYSLSPLVNGLKLNHACDIFASFAEFGRLYPTMEHQVKSYALGYACGYMLDCCAHPYIYAMAGQYRAKNGSRLNDELLHCLIEHQLDAYIIWRECGIYPTKMRFQDALPPTSTVENELSAIYQYSLKRLFGITLSKERLKTVFNDFYERQELLDSKKGFKQQLILFKERLTGRYDITCRITPKVMARDFDYNNASHTDWKSPFDETGEMRHDSFHELFDDSISKAVKLCAGYLLFAKKGGDMCAFTGCLCPDTGIKNSCAYSPSQLKKELYN